MSKQQRLSSWPGVFFEHFMGQSPRWYKWTLLSLLGLNPLLLAVGGPVFTGWAILLQFIGTLALALKCYPLLPGGLLVLESAFLGLVSPDVILAEVGHNLEVLLLLLFMVAGIYFMKGFLAWVFTKILFCTRSKVKLSLMFSLAGAFLSAWLDALTVTAVMIAVTLSFYEIYNRVSYAERVPEALSESEQHQLGQADLRQFEGFLRNLLMHGAVGTALGGAMTLVGEPQNLLIGRLMGWNFADFFLSMAHVSIPVLLAGLMTVVLVEKAKIVGYGFTLPERVRNVLFHHTQRIRDSSGREDRYQLWVQALAAGWLIAGLALHLAPVGLIGLSVIVLLAALTGKSDEHQLGRAFEEAMPFASLLVVFFGIVGLIQTNGLFQPIIAAALSTPASQQSFAFFLASGILSAISDNVFVATIYIQEAIKAFHAGLITHHQLNALAVAINIGTNIPSVATPNGQAAFLFLLTSGIAARIKLSYLTMLKLALPYTVVLCLISSAFLSLEWLPHQEPRGLPPASGSVNH